MPVPTHGDSCQSRMWLTRCPDCNDLVYFFCCTCGSKVFFDLNYPPWNPHENRCIPYLFRYLRDVKGFSFSSIMQIIEEYAREKELPIPLDLRKKLLLQENKRQKKITLINIIPEDKHYDIIGNVFSVNPKINFYKKLNYDDNTFGRALLGKLVKESFAEIILREKPDEETYICNQFTFVIPLILCEKLKIRQNDFIATTIIPHSIPGRQLIWIASDLHKL